MPDSITYADIPLDPNIGPSLPVSPHNFLNTLLAKTLRVTTADGRFFIGDLECTDRDANIILARTTEYRQPTANEVRELVENAKITGRPDPGLEIDLDNGRVKAGFRSRQLGLVVLPGKHVTKIEVQESR